MMSSDCPGCGSHQLQNCLPGCPGGEEPAPYRLSIDGELDALARIVRLLAPFDKETQSRMAWYIKEKFCP